MTSQQILKADLLDILFDNRNKEYGAYVLRRDYPSHLKKAVGIMLLLVLLLLLISMVQPKKENNTGRLGKDTVIVDLVDIKIVDPEKPLQSQPQRKVEKAPPTKANPVYKVVPDNQITKPLSETDTSDIAIGPDNNPGNGGDGFVSGTPSTTTVITPVVKPEEPDEPIVYDASTVSVMPEFPGGDQAWMNYLKRMLRVPDELESGERKTVQVKFIVNVDGDITNVEVFQSAGTVFDKEVLRVIGRMPKWKAGMQKGKPVAVYFTQPVTFVGEED
jgi:protein TonB